MEQIMNYVKTGTVGIGRGAVFCRCGHEKGRDDRG